MSAPEASSHVHVIRRLPIRLFRQLPSAQQWFSLEEDPCEVPKCRGEPWGPASGIAKEKSKSNSRDSSSTILLSDKGYPLPGAHRECARTSFGHRRPKDGPRRCSQLRHTIQQVQFGSRSIRENLLDIQPCTEDKTRVTPAARLPQSPE
jgi:hypothetical protein